MLCSYYVLYSLYIFFIQSAVGKRKQQQQHFKF